MLDDSDDAKNPFGSHPALPSRLDNGTIPLSDNSTDGGEKKRDSGDDELESDLTSSAGHDKRMVLTTLQGVSISFIIYPGPGSASKYPASRYVAKGRTSASSAIHMGINIPAIVAQTCQ